MALTFEATEDGRNPEAKEVAIKNAGSGTLEWEARTDQLWLYVFPETGTAPEQPDVSVDISDLEPGTHTGTVTISATTDGTSSPRHTIDVSLVIEEQQANNNSTDSASLQIDPAQLSFDGSTGTDLASQTFRVSSSDGSSFSWTVDAEASWIQVTPTSGQGASDVAVSVDPLGLGSGEHQATLTVKAPDLNNSPMTVEVRVTLTQLTINATPEELTLAAPEGGGAVSRELEITTEGDDALTWQIQTNRSWLQVDPTEGMGNATVTLTAAPGDLPVGTETGTLTISSASAPAQDVAVEFIIRLSKIYWIDESAAPTYQLKAADVAEFESMAGRVLHSVSGAENVYGLTLSGAYLYWVETREVHGTYPDWKIKRLELDPTDGLRRGAAESVLRKQQAIDASEGMSFDLREGIPTSLAVTEEAVFWAHEFESSNSLSLCESAHASGAFPDAGIYRLNNLGENEKSIGKLADGCYRNLIIPPAQPLSLEFPPFTIFSAQFSPNTMYWVGPRNSIERAHKVRGRLAIMPSWDFANADELVPPGNYIGDFDLSDYCLNECSRRIYWATDGAILSADNDGSNQETLVSTLTSVPIDLEANAFGEWSVYWLDRDGKLYRADGSGRDSQQVNLGANSFELLQ